MKTLERLSDTLLFFILVVVGYSLASCASEKKKVNEADPGKVAVSYYHKLMCGQYKDFVSGIESCEGKTANYREQMEMMVKQHIWETKENSGGMKSIQINRVMETANKKSVTVFLNITYKNGQVEEIDVPMVLVNGKWKMI